MGIAYVHRRKGWVGRLGSASSADCRRPPCDGLCRAQGQPGIAPAPRWQVAHPPALVGSLPLLRQYTSRTLIGRRPEHALADMRCGPGIRRERYAGGLQRGKRFFWAWMALQRPLGPVWYEASGCGAVRAHLGWVKVLMVPPPPAIVFCCQPRAEPSGLCRRLPSSLDIALPVVVIAPALLARVWNRLLAPAHFRLSSRARHSTAPHPPTCFVSHRSSVSSRTQPSAPPTPSLYTRAGEATTFTPMAPCRKRTRPSFRGA